MQAKKQPSRFKRWLLQGYLAGPEGPYESEKSQHHHKEPWYKVMCLTGCDYFSTLGYQPGIAFLAAGYLSPISTLILVLVTLFGALPIYRRVAVESAHGEGSIGMLERLLPSWQGKAFVLVMLGFVATDFVITMTLSAADSAAHLIENPLLRPYLEGKQVLVSLSLLGILGAIFLKGFKEAVGIAVVLVVTYLTLNTIVAAEGLHRLFSTPGAFTHWHDALSHSHGGSPLALLGVALLVYPKLALGLSGFETAVSVIPLVKGQATDTERNPAGRIKNMHRLLTTAAIIMCTFLIATSVVTTLLIPEQEFAQATASSPAGKANGRALAYLAHEFFGEGFGTVYDVSTILILSFAGASAMAGMLNIVPRYLPRYGMAPEWTKALRPLVLVYTAISFTVTIIFKADVNAQGGAYATGVLVLMTGACTAVMLSCKRRGARTSMWMFAVVALVLLYTTAMNIFERPDGLRIATFFIGTIIVISFVSRIWRTLELRVDQVNLDLPALNFIREAVSNKRDRICLVPNRPETEDEAEYARQDHEARRDHQIAPEECVLFIEVAVPDASEFSGVLQVKGVQVGPYRVLRATGTAVPNAIAAIALRVRDLSGTRPHLYFNWGERHPALYLIKYLFFGQGDTAPLTREILRRVEPDPEKRPAVHVA